MMNDADNMEYDSSGDCPYCQERGKNWQGGDLNCAFRGAVEKPWVPFSPDNWNCAAVNWLRQIAEHVGMSMRHGDSSGGFAPIADEDGVDGWIMMAWYKDRGRTSSAAVVSEHEVRPLRFEDAKKAIDYYRSVIDEEYEPEADESLAAGLEEDLRIAVGRDLEALAEDMGDPPVKLTKDQVNRFIDVMLDRRRAPEPEAEADANDCTPGQTEEDA